MNLLFGLVLRKRRSVALAGSIAAMLMALLPSSIHSQSMDYGALEQLFKEPVTTSVTGSPQRVSDVPATMEIITAEEIRRSGAKDIPGVLRHVGGIDTLEWGNDNVDVGVRGYDQAYSSRLLVLVDGRQVYVDDYGYTPWSSVPVELSAIRQIEIIKGPNSALFGFNAVNGVINIITYNPFYDKVNTISSTGGTQELATGSTIATYKFGSRAAVRFSAGGNSNSDFSTPIPILELTTPRERQYRGAINVNSVIRLNEKMLLGVEASHSNARLNEMGPTYKVENSKYGVDSLKAQLTAESRVGLLQATVYTNWLRNTVNPGAVNQPFHFKSRVTVAEFQDIFKLGADHTLRAAVEYRNSTEGSTPTVGASIGDEVFAASGMWNWQVTPTLSLTNALRLDHLSLSRVGSTPPGYPFTNSDWNRSFTQPSFNSGLVWKPRETDSIRFMVSRGAELPNLSISGGYLVVTPFFKVTGSPLLKPSVVTNYEIGWDHILPGPHILFRVSVFDQDSKDILGLGGGYISTPNGQYSFPSNVGSSDATGLELQLKGTPAKNYHWSVSYRLEKISDQFTQNALDGAAYVDYDDTTPLHLVKGNLGWANNKWEIDSYLQFHSNAEGLVPAAKVGTTLVPFAGFVSVDGRVAYKLSNRFTWAVSGQNLIRSSQIQTSGPAVERGVLGTLTFDF
jgi:outer membrane receptor for ferrienterochelin and colicins